MGSKSVTFIDPNNPVASQLQYEQLQRRQDMIDAMRVHASRTLQGGSIGGIAGYVSPLEGLANIAEDLAAGIRQKRLNKDAMALGNNAQNSQRALFNLPPNPVPQTDSAPSGRNLGQRIGDFLSGRHNGGGGDQSPMPSAPAPMATPMPQTAPVAQQAPMPPQAAPEQALPQQAPQGGGSYPMSLSGNPQQDYADYMQNRDEYTKAVIASHAPVDIARRYEQAAEYAAKGQVGKAAAIYQSIAKDNYIAPLNGRPGSTIRDPMNPSHILGYDAPTQQGGIPIYGEDGSFQGYRPATGAREIEAGMAGAKAGSVAAAQAPYELVDQVDPVSGRTYRVPKSTITGGGGQPAPAPAGGPPPTRGAGGPGAITGIFGGATGGPPAPSKLGPGEIKAGEVIGDASGKAFAGIQDGAREVPQRIGSLREAQGLSNSGLATGPFANKLNEFGKKFGIDALVDPKGQVFAKDVARLVSQSAGELGLNGSDARLGAVQHANPNMEMKPAALKEIFPVLIGLEIAKGAKANAAQNWVTTHGPGTNAQFESWWRQNYDPRLFTQIAKGPDAFAANLKRLNPQSREFYMSRYKAMRAAGVNFGSLTQ